MRRMPKPLLLLLTGCLLPAAALAQPYKRLVNQAAETLEDVDSAARRARGPCRQAVVEPLERTIDRTYRLRRSARPDEVQAVRGELDALAASAAMAGCPAPVLDQLQRAQDTLEDVRQAAWRDRGNWRRDDDDDQAVPKGQPGFGFATLGALSVRPAVRFENEQAVKLSVNDLKLQGLQGHTFYFGARFRSAEGPWSEWITTQQFSVTQDPQTWRNPFNHFFRYSTLAETDRSQGRFVAQVAVFDAQTSRVLATREAPFRAEVPRLPEPPTPPQPQARDCGTGADPGCTVSRDGVWPLDAAGFNALQGSLRNVPSELGRSQLLQSALQRNGLTAIQFGLLLDLFPNEGLKLSVARSGAGRVVNPEYALGYASKWSNPAYQAQYVDLIRSQAAGQPTQPQPPPPPQQLPDPGWPGGPNQPGGPFNPNDPRGLPRDCGTGADPGCGMSRNGTAPMDGATYRGVLAALKATPNELSRKEYCEAVLQREALTALQLGGLLEQFPNELLRLDVARMAAPRVVDARRALGLASTFRNTLLGADFARLMAQQP